MHLNLSRQAAKSLKQLSKSNPAIAKLIATNLSALLHDPEPTAAKLLVHYKYWRLRVSDYRIVYKTAHHEVIVLLIEHRSTIYKLLKRLS